MIVDDLFCYPCFSDRDPPRLIAVINGRCDMCSSCDAFHPSDLNPTDLTYFNELMEP